MLIASSSQMPRGTASRSASPAAVMAARTARAVLRLVSGSPRRGSLPRGPKSSDFASATEALPQRPP